MSNIKYGDKDKLAPGDLDPANGWIRLDAYDRLRAERDRYKAALETLAAQSSGEPGSLKKSDCMAAIAKAALRYK